MNRRQREQLAEILDNANDKIYSCGCPYLALADEIGFITPFVVRKNPSNFGRMSLKKILLCGGFGQKNQNTKEYRVQHSKFIFQCLELGYDLSTIAKFLRWRYDNLLEIKEFVSNKYFEKNQSLTN